MSSRFARPSLKWMRATSCGITYSHVSRLMMLKPRLIALITSSRLPYENHSVIRRRTSCSTRELFLSVDSEMASKKLPMASVRCSVTFALASSVATWL